MKQRLTLVGFRLFGFALALAALCGYRCPAQGCPACKWVGK